MAPYMCLSSLVIILFMVANDNSNTARAENTTEQNTGTDTLETTTHGGAPEGGGRGQEGGGGEGGGEGGGGGWEPIHVVTNNSEVMVYLGTNHSRMQVDLFFEACPGTSKPRALLVGLRTPAGNCLADITLRQDSMSLHVKTNVSDAWGSKDKAMSIFPDPLTSSCYQPRSLRIVVNSEEGVTTLTLLPLIFQTTANMTGVFHGGRGGGGVGGVLVKSFDGYQVKWNISAEPIPPVEKSHLPPVHLEQNVETQRTSGLGGNSFRRLFLNTTHHPTYSLMQVVIFVTVGEDNDKPFVFHLTNSRATVDVEMTCRTLSLTVQNATVPGHIRLNTARFQQTRLFGNCNRERTIVLLLHSDKKRLTVIVLPLTTQGSLMFDDFMRNVTTDFFGSSFQELIVDPSHRHWRAAITPLGGTAAGGGQNVGGPVTERSTGGGAGGPSSPFFGMKGFPVGDGVGVLVVVYYCGMMMMMMI